VYLVVNWAKDGAEMDAFSGSVIRNPDFYFRPGLTWPLRSHRFAPQAMPAGCIFSVRGYCAFPEKGEEAKTLAIFNSGAFDYLYKTALGRFGFPEFIVGMLQIMPWADAPAKQRAQFEMLARRAWSLKRTLDTIEETSHAFALPAALRVRLRDYDPPAIEAGLARIQVEIDAIAFDLYGFSEADRLAVAGGLGSVAGAEDIAFADEDDDEVQTGHGPQTTDHLLSWAVGVAFGRFDWRLATGERAVPAEPYAWGQV